MSTRKRSANAKSPTKESPAKQTRTEISQPSGVEISIEDKFHPDGSKVFNDPVHGHMEFHPLCVAIIDTPQFQRLRNLKQLGATYSVYPGAAHNRFEHSLGVGHLAGELVYDLRTRQPELKITWKDILCVQIAGLCHDLGHGPFSHLFEHRFVPATRDKSKPKWTHEDASVNMFNYMIEQEANGLKEKFRKWGFGDGEQQFMKELILGKHPSREEDCFYDNEKAFLYEIVANKRNGVDVDKWDYFKRDCLQLGIFSSFDHTRFMKFARVIKVEQEGRQICVREKEALDVYQMFHTRHSLHLKAYQHKSAYVIGVMLTDALIEANDHIRIPKDNGKLCKMSECVDAENIDAYMNLTDNVVSHILLTANPKLEDAKKLLRDVERRKLYKCVGESMPSKDSDTFDEKMVENGINEEVRRIGGKSLTEQYPDSKFVVQVVKLDFGKGDENPVDHLLFFSKHDKTKAVHVRPAEVSSFLPQVVFKEQLVRVFFRLTDNPQRDLGSLKLLQEGFQNWCKSKIGEKGFKFFNIPKSLANQAVEPNEDLAM